MKPKAKKPKRVTMADQIDKAAEVFRQLRKSLEGKAKN